ncbi:hypothetical protein L596_001319 [Steinernema carpocapsae]|uniref:Uncharacterized protein n=1 Tax=Steinernema carpocapsae TaxID=34508 RepID=A0A4U8UL78_STECR|nr:hypothetical protein L596_001319 [Steinernema carpocapsae]
MTAFTTSRSITSSMRVLKLVEVRIDGFKRRLDVVHSLLKPLDSLVQFAVGNLQDVPFFRLRILIFNLENNVVISHH